MPLSPFRFSKIGVLLWLNLLCQLKQVVTLRLSKHQYLKNFDKLNLTSFDDLGKLDKVGFELTLFYVVIKN